MLSFGCRYTRHYHSYEEQAYHPLVAYTITLYKIPYMFVIATISDLSPIHSL